MAVPQKKKTPVDPTSEEHLAALEAKPAMHDVDDMPKPPDLDAPDDDAPDDDA